jgi:hypothetical protein
MLRQRPGATFEVTEMQPSAFAVKLIRALGEVVAAKHEGRAGQNQWS